MSDRVLEHVAIAAPELLELCDVLDALFSGVILESAVGFSCSYSTNLEHRDTLLIKISFGVGLDVFVSDCSQHHAFCFDFSKGVSKESMRNYRKLGICLPDLLVVNQWLSKGLSLVNILSRQFESLLKLCSASHRHKQSFSTQIVHQKLEASVDSFFSSQDRVCRKTHVIEEKFRRVRTCAADFFQKFSLKEIYKLQDGNIYLPFSNPGKLVSTRKREIPYAAFSASLSVTATTIAMSDM